MRQSIRNKNLVKKKNDGNKSSKPKNVKKKKASNKPNHPKYGTSKLEEIFAHEFLDVLGVEYQYQFEAKDIGRFFDFYLPKSNLIIEVDGDYYHSNPKFYKENELNPMQKHNKRVDEQKNKWALLHGIPILRIWENDIRKDKEKVFKILRERLYLSDKKLLLKERKRKRGIKKEDNNQEPTKNQ